MTGQSVEMRAVSLVAFLLLSSVNSPPPPLFTGFALSAHVKIESLSFHSPYRYVGWYNQIKKKSDSAKAGSGRAVVRENQVNWM